MHQLGVRTDSAKSRNRKSPAKQRLRGLGFPDRPRCVPGELGQASAASCLTGRKFEHGENWRAFGILCVLDALFFDEQVAAVWKTIITTEGGAEWLANEIVNFKLTPESAKSLLASHPTSARKLAFKTIVQNRVSHGGILADGAGVIKHGENGKGILSRWYPTTLKKRILDIPKVRKQITFIQGDAFAVLKQYLDKPNIAIFVDPPYTASKKKAGTRLYKYHQVDHEKLFELMSNVKGDFLMTYDDDEEVRSLALKYRFETRLVAMNNTRHATMTELLIGRNLNWMNRS